MAEDVDWIVSTARQQDPALEQQVAVELASLALGVARGLPELDAPEIARRLMADTDEAVSSVNAVAVATVDYLQQEQP